MSDTFESRHYRTMRLAVCRKPLRLAGDDVVFLRLCLRLTRTRLAELTGVSARAVRRWETDGAPVGQSADRLIRMLTLVDLSETDPKWLTVLENIRNAHGPAVVSNLSSWQWRPAWRDDP